LFHEWWEDNPVFIEMDLVVPCGASSSGQYQYIGWWVKLVGRRGGKEDL